MTSIRYFIDIVESAGAGDPRLLDDWHLVSALNLNFFGERSATGQKVRNTILQRAREVLSIKDGDIDFSDVRVKKFVDAIRTIRHYADYLHYLERTEPNVYDEWYKLGSMDFDAMVAVASKFVATQAQKAVADSDDEDDEEDDLPDSPDRFHYYDPNMDRHTYIRFGLDPKGRSVFGLSQEPTEDGPDEWAVATGNKTSEEGLCVFRAHRHADDPKGWVLEEPDFSKAVYSPSGWATYLLSIAGKDRLCKWKRNPSMRFVHVVRGSIVQNRTRMRHRGKPIVLTPLGSDGEYLIDPFKPYIYEPIGLEYIYMDDHTRLVDFLDQRGFWRTCNDEEG
jgi:hypothetical protein